MEKKSIKKLAKNLYIKIIDEPDISFDQVQQFLEYVYMEYKDGQWSWNGK